MHRHTGLFAFATVIALSAWFGVIGLFVGYLDFGDEITDRLPWDSPVLAGIALAMVVAAPMTLLAILAWRGDRRTGAMAVAAGVLQIWWIVVQIAFIREFSFFHPLYVAVGTVLIMWGRNVNRTSAPA